MSNIHYLYITTNKINGKKYVGQRKLPKDKTVNNDLYIGSGNLLLNAIKKYGKDNFTKEIVSVHDSQSEVDKAEILFIKENDVLNNKDKWYNIDAGGQYGRSEEHAEIKSRSMKKFYNNRKNYERFIIKTTKHKSLEEYENYKELKKINEDIRKVNRAKINRLNKQIRLIKDQYAKEQRDTQEHKDKIRQNILKANMLSNTGDAKQKRISNRSITLKNKRDNNIDHFTIDSKIAFSRAHYNKAGNMVGVWLIDTYNINPKEVNKIIKKLITTEYKDQSNYYKQIDNLKDKANKLYSININEAMLNEMVVKTRVTTLGPPR